MTFNEVHCSNYGEMAKSENHAGMWPLVAISLLSLLCHSTFEHHSISTGLHAPDIWSQNSQYTPRHHFQSGPSQSNKNLSVVSRNHMPIYGRPLACFELSSLCHQ